MDHLRTLFLVHESNAQVFYGQDLARQIPRSHAAQAFNHFQNSMHLFELVRLCALWDPYGDDRESIPTVLTLIDKPEIRAHIIADARAVYSTGANQTLKLYMERRADETEAACSALLYQAAKFGLLVASSARLKALQDYRHRYIAHNLTVDPEATVEVRKVRLGDESAVLSRTVWIADALHQALNGSGFAWSGLRDISRRNARALWENCTFNVSY